MVSFRSAAVLTMAAAVVVPGHGKSLLSLVCSQTQSLPSVVTPIREADVSAQVEGEVVDVLVHEGDPVRVGQTLVRIDDRIPAAQVNVAEAVADCRAGIELAESELRQARRVRDRMLAGQALGAVADAEVDLAVAGFELAEAHLLQARELYQQNCRQLKLEQERLNAHLIQAPFDGSVLRIQQSTGSSVAQGTPVIRIADVSRLRAIVFMPFSWFDRVYIGQQISLQASSPLDRLVDAEIVSVEPVIDAATETFRCVVEIDNTACLLPSGFTVVVGEQHLSSVAAVEGAEQE